MVEKKKDKNPTRVIIRYGEQYVHLGEVPDTRKLKTEVVELKKEAGRKTVLVKAVPGWVSVYISKKFYPSICKSEHPYHGKGTLR